MTAAVITVTKPTGVSGSVIGNKKMKFRDVTADTGTYTTGGFTVTASQLGLRHIDMVAVGSVATEGTSGANAAALGVTYAADGTSVTIQSYESAATGLPMLEKTSAEAYPANFTVRLMAIGY